MSGTDELGNPAPNFGDYHRAAGVYTMDKEMQELGTAAVHLLTMATSYMNAHNE